MPAVNKRNHDSEQSKTEICNSGKVKEAINALKLLEKMFVEKDLRKQPLLENGDENIVFLQIMLKKIPPPQLLKMIRVSLPHSLITETSDICLITGDIEKSNHKAEIEPTVLHYKDLLTKHGVTNVAQVIPLRQLRTEYKTFESRHQLAAAYDVFLVDKKIAGVVPKTLGKSFFKGRKFPIQIDMKRPNLKEKIDKALCQSKFSLTCRGNSYALEIARLSMENEVILENIMSSIEVLANELPGKANNILSLFLKTAKSKAIPIYVSFDPADISIKKPHKNQTVGLDELSTLDNAEVKVFRDGRVILRKITKKSTIHEDAAEDDTDTNLNEPFSGDVLVENEDTQESIMNLVSLKKKKGKKTGDLIEITDSPRLENKDHTQDSDNISPKKKKKGKKNYCFDQVAVSSQVGNEDIQHTETIEIPSKKRKERKISTVDNILGNEKDSQSSPKTTSKKKNKNKMNLSHVEVGEALEDMRDISELLISKKQKIHKTDNVNEKAEKIKNKARKVSGNEDKGEIETDTQSKRHRSILEMAKNVSVKTPKYKKEKKTKNVIASSKKETSLISEEDKKMIQNEKTPSKTKKVKNESAEITSSVSKRKQTDVENGKKRNKRMCKS